jgi:hypothetical protein
MPDFRGQKNTRKSGSFYYYNILPGAECLGTTSPHRTVKSVNRFKMKTATIGSPSRLKAPVLLAGMVAVVLIGNGKLTLVSR